LRSAATSGRASAMFVFLLTGADAIARLVRDAIRAHLAHWFRRLWANCR
jgi:hypothetical protein